MRSFGRYATTISRACGFGPMSMQLELARAVRQHALAALDEQELRLARFFARRSSCGAAAIVSTTCAIALRRDDRRALGDEAAQAADVIAVMVRHRDVADRLAGNRRLDARDDFVGAGTGAGRLDRDDVILERDRQRVLVLARDVLDHEHAVGKLARPSRRECRAALRRARSPRRRRRTTGP